MPAATSAGAGGEGGGEDARPQPRSLGRNRGRAQPGERRRAVPAVVAPGLEVVGDRDDLEAGALGPARELEQLDRPELLRGCLVAEPHARKPWLRRGNRPRLAERRKADSA